MIQRDVMGRRARGQPGAAWSGIVRDSRSQSAHHQGRRRAVTVIERLPAFFFVCRARKLGPKH
jgi:hypothetical protein